MKYDEFLKLKKGDLVIVKSEQNKIFKGLVFEIDSIHPESNIRSHRAILKQPGFDEGFRIEYSGKLLERYES